ncbi:MAG: S-adenosylmethionine:tRNA ribosyltransferase-isomerase, partial [Ilumatobacteraceae bacterium]
MRLDDFDYVLPEERIAQHPVEPRDSARLLVDQGGAAPLHRHVSDIGEFLREGDLLVVNDSRVIPARLRLARATGGAAEALLLDPLDADRRVWEALMRPAKKLKPGEELFSNGVPLVRVVRRSHAGDTMVVELIGDGDPLGLLQVHGEMPLPPYITATLDRPDRYQTVYSREPGSAAAPTAGLHFTPELLAQLAARGVETARVELVVGLDTFKPVSEADPTQHPMHSE